MNLSWPTVARGGAPPVFRPQPPRLAAPPVYRPGATPVTQRRPVIQRAWEGYNTPPTTPLFSPPSPYPDEETYFRHGMEYHTNEGNEKAADKWEDAYSLHTGKSIGQSYGAQESEDYDSSYIDIPQGIRPSAPANLWNKVYGGLKPHPTNSNFLLIQCAELGDGPVLVDAGTKCEKGTTKRPPMCHIISYNHIKWAVGVPSTKTGNDALVYVRHRPQKIQPGWF